MERSEMFIQKIQKKLSNNVEHFFMIKVLKMLEIEET